jgi:hypothetical protein
MRRFVLLSSSVLAVALVAGFALLRAPEAPKAVPEPVAAAPAPTPEAPDASDAVEALPAPLPFDLASIPEPEPPGGDPERVRELVAADPRLSDRAEQQALAPLADARWHEGVDQAEYRAEDFDPAVRRMFDRIELEPRYAEGGMIEGLTIQRIDSDHPLAAAGFTAGDRIDRIQGVELRDPAEIPALLAHLGPHIEVCARRADGSDHICRELALE